MDLRMPALNGIDAARQIRKLPGRSKTPILALTASVFTKDSEACFAAGMNDFIGKPVNPDKLFATLLKWLEKSQ
jgi:CheY-like chemotaxis protein